MTTVDEARDPWQWVHDEVGLSWDDVNAIVVVVEAEWDKREAAIRAEYSEHVDRYQYETDTAMDYGAGYLEGKRESAETLAALRSAAQKVIDSCDYVDGTAQRIASERALDRLRAALAATPAEDER